MTDFTEQLHFIEMLAKQNATPEEKKIQALIKTALYSDNIITFIDEVSKAFNGCGKVRVDTVKGSDRVLQSYHRSSNTK